MIKNQLQNLRKTIAELALDFGVLQWACSLILLIGLYGCSPSSSEDFQREGEALTRTLIKHLEAIETQEDLLRAEPTLKKDFEAYVDLITQAREQQLRRADEIVVDASSDFSVSGELKEVMRRIYAMEGGREIIERAQQEALVRLDAYERAQTKQRK
ncbi:MAG: hypothetical protein JSR93_06890 [Verrucomicrobia bacterium]|nr:hypothetical protein [Verrucomicrobiota bacterium]